MYGNSRPHPTLGCSTISFRHLDLGEALSEIAALGFTYLQGQSVVKDEKQAAQWIRKAADKGHRGAMTILGFISSPRSSSNVGLE